MSASKRVLRFAGVRFRYPGTDAAALDGVTLDVGGGEGIGLFGPNGAGKTTLLRLAMGLIRGAAGTVELGDLEPGADPEDRARVAGYLFQQPEAQLFERTVERDVAFGPRCLGWNETEVAEATRKALEEVGLSRAAEEHPYNLSAPHRRLVALAAVLAPDPPLLLLDEPTAGLDRGSRAVVRDAVLRRRASGSAVLAVTHDGEFALEALDRGVILERGRITASATVAELLGRQGAPTPPPAALLTRQLGLTVAVPRFESVVSALVGSLPHPHTAH
ncbi:MAG TPA: ABC transporter ATP-binding protein [Gemmatimonadales bacterium]|nr:ABC transporter ATP-binding protein [Gemmatimonadales bacterium]